MRTMVLDSRKASFEETVRKYEKTGVYKRIDVNFDYYKVGRENKRQRKDRYIPQTDGYVVIMVPLVELEAVGVADVDVEDTDGEAYISEIPIYQYDGLLWATKDIPIQDYSSRFAQAIKTPPVELQETYEIRYPNLKAIEVDGYSRYSKRTGDKLPNEEYSYDNTEVPEYHEFVRKLWYVFSEFMIINGDCVKTWNLPLVEAKAYIPNNLKECRGVRLDLRHRGYNAQFNPFSVFSIGDMSNQIKKFQEACAGFYNKYMTDTMNPENVEVDTDGVLDFVSFRIFDENAFYVDMSEYYEQSERDVAPEFWKIYDSLKSNRSNSNILTQIDYMLDQSDSIKSNYYAKRVYDRYKYALRFLHFAYASETQENKDAHLDMAMSYLNATHPDIQAEFVSNWLRGQ